MAQYKLRQKPGAKHPEVSKWGSGFNVVAVLICILVAVILWVCSISIEFRREQDQMTQETGETVACLPCDEYTV